MMRTFALLNTVSLAMGAVLFDGRFNDMTSSAELDAWSFSNPVGPYQYYIVCSHMINPSTVTHKLNSMVLMLPLPTSTLTQPSRTLPTLAAPKESRSASQTTLSGTVRP